ncbi:unnamed protein product [Linum trigynum]|uniref:Uncharacterized protein n=1 Tax=Linum trigynum TaxID=586398 RepID=A0AAV2EB64_9ROSI
MPCRHSRRGSAWACMADKNRTSKVRFSSVILPIKDPSDEGENNVSADSSDPLEGADDSGPESDSTNDDEVARDCVPVPYYNHIPDDNWMVDSDMEPPEVPIWGPLTGFMQWP